MSLKNKLKEQAAKTLAVTVEKGTPKNLAPSIKPIDKITLEIKAYLQELSEIKDFVFEKRKQVNVIREQVIKSLIYVRDNKKDLLTGSFEEYLESEIGITKGYFYEQVQAYEICQAYNVPAYFSQVDYKILVYIARVKDKEKQKSLILNATQLNREEIKKVSQTDKKKLKEISYKVEKNVLKFELTEDFTEEQIREILSFMKEKYLVKTSEV